jgi:hypothetical protein
MTQRDVAWLDHHLRGGPPPGGAAVRVYLQQAGTWLDFGQWPPEATTGVAWHLRPGGGLSRDPEPGDPAPATFTYDPADPTPSAGGPLLEPPGKQVDNTATEARSDVLTFTSDPLPADTDLAGPVRATIWVRVSREHADVFARLCDVDERGISRNVVDGIRRLSPATVPAADVTRDPDGILAVGIELDPTGYRLRAGHRIRLQVSGGAFPAFARNFGTGEPFATATRAHRCAFEIYAGARHPSRVLLPVLRSVRAAADPQVASAS